MFTRMEKSPLLINDSSRGNDVKLSISPTEKNQAIAEMLQKVRPSKLRMALTVLLFVAPVVYSQISSMVSTPILVNI